MCVVSKLLLVLAMRSSQSPQFVEGLRKHPLVHFVQPKGHDVAVQGAFDGVLQFTIETKSNGRHIDVLNNLCEGATTVCHCAAHFVKQCSSQCVAPNGGAHVGVIA